MADRKNKSLVWQYFEKKDSNTVQCTYCQQTMRYFGNTSNLASHIRRRHTEALLTPNKSDSVEVSSLQSRLAIEMQESPGVKTLDNSLVEMIVKDMQPLSIVENVGFQNFVRKLNPLYQLPSRKRVTYELLPCLFSTVKASVLEEQHKAEHFALTTDIWSSDSNM